MPPSKRSRLARLPQTSSTRRKEEQMAPIDTHFDLSLGFTLNFRGGDIGDNYLWVVVLGYTWQSFSMVIDCRLWLVDCGPWVAILSCAWRSFVVGSWLWVVGGNSWLSMGELCYEWGRSQKKFLRGAQINITKKNPKNNLLHTHT